MRPGHFILPSNLLNPYGLLFKDEIIEAPSFWNVWWYSRMVKQEEQGAKRGLAPLSSSILFNYPFSTAFRPWNLS
jgi:hypothetical protein